MVEDWVLYHFSRHIVAKFSHLFSYIPKEGVAGPPAQQHDVLTIFNLYCYGFVGSRLVANCCPLAVSAPTVQQ